MTMPSGLVQLPWVFGALVVLVLLVLVLVALGEGLAVGEGEAVGDGEVVGAGAGDGEVVVVLVGVLTLKLTLLVELLPAASTALAVRVCVPAATPENGRLHDVVPIAGWNAAPSRAR
jgi:hypothetical protein